MDQPTTQSPEQSVTPAIDVEAIESVPPSQATESATTPPEVDRESSFEREFLEQNIQHLFNDLTTVSGQIVLPCVPSLLSNNLQVLEGLFKVLGNPFNDEELKELYRGMTNLVQSGFQKSPNSRLVITYKPNDPPERGLSCTVTTESSSITDRYQDWIAHRQPPLFGAHADARVLAIAAELGDPSTAPILDVGAGSGRNSLPLAQLGHPVDALELVPDFVEQIVSAASTAGVKLTARQGDILDPLVRPRAAYYQLAIAAEVVASHFRDPDQVRLLLAKLCDSVRSGGYILFSAFLARDGFQPDDRIRELSQVYWSYILTRDELQAAMVDLPLEWLSDESVHDYEQAHLPAEAWPPTSWFIGWAKGRNLFPVRRQNLRLDYDQGVVPLEEELWLELRWILCRRR